MRIEIVVYDGFDDLDAFGPHEVLSHAAGRIEGWEPGEIVLVGARGPGTVTSAHGVRLTVAQGLGDEPADGVVVPGGGWSDAGRPGARAEADDGTLTRRLAELATTTRWMASVCTGGLLLAAAGLTTGRPAVTHHAFLNDLRAYGAEVLEDARVVDDGDLVTAGGVTSGFDLALHLVAREAGEDVADRVADHIAYRRQPGTVVRGQVSTP